MKDKIKTSAPTSTAKAPLRKPATFTVSRPGYGYTALGYTGADGLTSVHRRGIPRSPRG